jgi:hypothetical protein
MALIDKTLTVTGERHFYLRPTVQRLLCAALAWASLGLVRRPPWRLSRPSLFTTLPLRDTHAYGGQNRIGAGHPGAAGIGAADRLTPEQLAAHPDAGADADTAAYRRPVAHAACMSNLAGTGFATGWFLLATGQRRMAAPRIEAGDAPLTARQFCRQLHPQRSASPAMPEPAWAYVRCGTRPAIA